MIYIGLIAGGGILFGLWLIKKDNASYGWRRQRGSSYSGTYSSGIEGVAEMAGDVVGSVFEGIADSFSDS